MARGRYHVAEISLMEHPDNKERKEYKVYIEGRGHKYGSSFEDVLKQMEEGTL